MLAIYSVGKWEPSAQKSVMQNLFIELLGPLQAEVSGFQKGIVKTIDDYFFLVDLKKENEVMRSELLELRNKLMGLEELGRENKRLKRQLSYEVDEGLKKIFAKVIAVDSFKDFRVLRLDRGRDVGVKVKDAVITPEGLVGFIYSVSKNFSEVLLINDVNSRVDIINKRTRARGIIEGFSGTTLVLKYSDLREHYEVGDVVLTAGLGFLPRGIAVAKVTEASGSMWGDKKKVFLKPIVDLAVIEDVLILSHLPELMISNDVRSE